MLRIGAQRRLDRCRNFGCWPFATFRCLVAVGGIADIGTRWRPEGSVACDPNRTIPDSNWRSLQNILNAGFCLIFEGASSILSLNHGMLHDANPPKAEGSLLSYRGLRRNFFIRNG